MIGVIDYEAGNLASVSNSLQRLNIPYQVTSDKNVLSTCKGIILPGVGAAPLAMDSLNRKDLLGFIRDLKKPFLGICLGMQLLFEYSEEGDTSCIGVIPGNIVQFDETVPRVPHMGWNRVEFMGSESLFNTIPASGFFYFANSYYAPVSEQTTGTTVCGVTFSASVRNQNFYGVQFHPEKSGEIGLKILVQFNSLCN